MKRILFILTLFFFALSANAGPSLTPEEKYDLGLKYLKRGNYQKALEQFNHIRNFYRDDPLAIEAELSIADLYFKKSEWDQARVYYDEFQRRYPTHPKIDYVTFKLGLCYYKKSPKTPERDQRWTEQAVSHWRNFDIKYPSSPHSKDVNKKYVECRNRLAEKELRIAKFYQKRSAWEGSKRRSDYLIKNYSESKHLIEALQINALANHNLGNQTLFQQSFDQLKKMAPDKVDNLNSKIEEANQRKNK